MHNAQCTMHNAQCTIFNVRPETTNIGNQLIELALHNYIREVFKKQVNIVTLPACNKGNSSKPVGLSAQSVYDINRYGDGVVVGGGNLFENGGLVTDLNAIKALDVPLMLFGVSWARIYNRQGILVPRTDSLTDTVIRNLSQQASITLVRDHTTAQYLTNLGIQSSIVACPALHLNHLSLNLPTPSLEVSNTVLISIRHPDRMCLPSNFQYRVYSDILEICEFLRKRGYDDIKLLCHDYKDIAFATAFPDIEFVYTEEPLQFLALLRTCKLNVTYRLHSFIPCLAFKVPSITFTYDERAQTLLETIGMQDWDINIVNTPNIVEMVEQRLDNLNIFYDLIEQSQEKLAVLRERIVHELNAFREQVIKRK